MGGHVMTLRPDADLLHPTGWTPDSGSTLWDRIADGSLGSPNDSTYIANAFDFTVASVRVADPTDSTYLTAPSIYIYGVRIRVRVKLGTGGLASSIRANLYRTDGDRGITVLDDLRPLTTSFVNLDGQWNTVDPFGQLWSRSAVQLLAVAFWENNIPQVILSTMEIEVGWIAGPATVVTGPSGTVLTSTPDVTWTSTQEDGRLQSLFQVKVFDQATYERGDFDPAHSTPFAESGGQNSTARTWRVNRPLGNATTYKAYVRTAVTISGHTVWSAWDDGATFNLAFDAPAVPLLRVEPQLDAGRIRLDLQALDNLLTTNEADLERDTASVLSWEVLGGSGATIANSATQAYHGTRSLKATSTGTATFEVIVPRGGAYVVPGETISASARVRAGSTGRSVRVSIASWNESGITGLQDGALATDSSSAWTLYKCEGFVVPAGTLFVTMQVTITTPANTEIHYVDEPMLARGLTAPAWSRGGLWTRNLLLIQDAGLETAGSVGTWLAGAGCASIAQSTTFAELGTGSLRLTATGSTGMNAYTSAGTAGVPVIPGEAYAILGSFRSAVTTRYGSLGIVWYDTAGNIIGADSDNVAVSQAGSWWPASRVGIVAPDDAAYAAVLVGITGSLAASELHYVDNISLARGNATRWSGGQDARLDTYFVVESSDDAGETWAPILHGSHIVPNLYQAALIYDNAIAPDAVRLYRARVETVDSFVSSDQAIASANTAPVAAGCPTRRWWIRSLAVNGLSVGSSSEFGVLRSPSFKREQRKGRFTGLGATLPTFVVDSTGGQDGQLQLVVYGNEIWAELDQIFRDGEEIYVVDPIEQRGYYAHLDSDVQWDEGVTLSGPKRTASISYSEVAAP